MVFLTAISLVSAEICGFWKVFWLFRYGLIRSWTTLMIQIEKTSYLWKTAMQWCFRMVLCSVLSVKGLPNSIHTTYYPSRTESKGFQLRLLMGKGIQLYLWVWGCLCLSLSAAYLLELAFTLIDNENGDSLQSFFSVFVSDFSFVVFPKQLFVIGFIQRFQTFQYKVPDTKQVIKFWRVSVCF